MENDPLKSVLREWEAPEPPVKVDEAIRARYARLQRVPWWRWIWTARVSIPVPALAGFVAVLFLWMQLWPRSVMAPARMGVPATASYVTQVDWSGFQPLPDGEIRVIRAGGRTQ